jgi:chromosome partitioning protein
MIVTIVHAALPAAGAQLAANLALLRGRSGGQVTLLDASPARMCTRWSLDRARSRLRPAVATVAASGGGFADALERCAARDDDIVICTDGADSPECRRALIAARVALVPLAPGHADAGRDLVTRLGNARMFNPGLRVLFVTAGGERDPAPAARAAMRAFADRVPAAGIAATTVHLPALQWGTDVPGRCASDIVGSAGAAEMRALYEEVYRFFQQ